MVVSGFQVQQESKHQCVSHFRASACILSVAVPLAKASSMTNPDSPGKGNKLHLLSGRICRFTSPHCGCPVGKTLAIFIGYHTHLTHFHQQDKTHCWLLTFLQCKTWGCDALIVDVKTSASGFPGVWSALPVTWVQFESPILMKTYLCAFFFFP